MAIGLHTDLVVISCMAVYQSSVTHEGFQKIIFLSQFAPKCSRYRVITLLILVLSQFSKSCVFCVFHMPEIVDLDHPSS